MTTRVIRISENTYHRLLLWKHRIEARDNKVYTWHEVVQDLINFVGENSEKDPSYEQEKADYERERIENR